jgi:glutamyl-tRNA reductase
VLFVGAGEMIELAATHFAAKNPKAIAIANRTLERGEKLAVRFGGEVMRLADLPERLHEFDAVVSCTASTLPIIGLGAVERALKKRRHRPMFMVDLAVPRDIEPEVKALETSTSTPWTTWPAWCRRPGQPPGRRGAGRGHHRRGRAELHALDGPARPVHGVVPLIQQLNAQADEWRAAEIARARKLLAKGEIVDAVLEALARGLTQKMLHGAMAELHSGDPAHREQTRTVAPVLALKATAACRALAARAAPSLATRLIRRYVYCRRNSHPLPFPRP